MLKKLREPTYEVTEKIIVDMKDTILDVIGRCQAYMVQNNQLAIAANQVGSNFRILCYMDTRGKIINCINPEILKKQHMIKVSAQDPSFPGLTCRLERYNKIKVKYIQAAGNLVQQEVTLKSHRAYFFQQCLDTLDNIIIFDRADLKTIWKNEHPKVYRTGKCTKCNNGKVCISKEPIRWEDCDNCKGTGQSGTKDYYIQGEDVMWFSGLKIDPDTIGGVTVGCKFDTKLQEPESKIITL